jgi:hypothetical protein
MIAISLLKALVNTEPSTTLFIIYFYKSFKQSPTSKHILPTPSKLDFVGVVVATGVFTAVTGAGAGAGAGAGDLIGVVATGVVGIGLGEITILPFVDSIGVIGLAGDLIGVVATGVIGLAGDLIGVVATGVIGLAGDLIGVVVELVVVDVEVEPVLVGVEVALVLVGVEVALVLGADATGIAPPPPPPPPAFGFDSSAGCSSVASSSAGCSAILVAFFLQNI